MVEEITNIPVPDLLKTFGRHLLSRFVVVLSVFRRGDIGLLCSFRGKKANKFPRIPQLEMTYRSARRLTDLAEGLILGTADRKTIPEDPSADLFIIARINRRRCVRRYQREKNIRQQAEKIAEEKSRELFLKSMELEDALKAESQARQEIEAQGGITKDKSFNADYQAPEIWPQVLVAVARHATNKVRQMPVSEERILRSFSGNRHQQ
ncbi:hypothetical protein [uncultured Desulfobacter sp.]|uniref:hypothetical protein n=1 Tax=uncultured Desulfobacter sp. TaxID=240139 RepID=UPI0029C8608C|nr:hypothetical protein [uncultured Desulfobacter sp.]